ncbi:hypothetical protein KY345_05180 [Candidatus Woesearchaeota archaeon]|nr:hypothetical protein [Candidatus Woesearchaeota archaeon]
MSRKEIIFLAVIFVLACSFRLFFVFNTPYFSDTSSYFHLRIAEDIKENHIPGFYDSLSYGGRTLLYSPVFYYIFYILTPFVPLEVGAKVFSSITISLLVIPVFLISKRLTNKTYASLLTSLLSIFIPANLSLTFNTFTPYSLIIPIIFFNLFFIMDIKKYTKHFIVTSILGALVHPSFLLLIIGYIFYLILVKIAGFETDKTRLEAILFSLLLTFWIVFIVYKNAFLMHGIAVIWQNIPEQILRHYFSGVKILEAIYKIGLIPLLAGVFVVYKYTSSKISRDIYFMISLVVTVALLTTLHLLEPGFGLALIGVILTTLFSVFLSDFWDYFANARFKLIRTALILIITTALVFTNLIPSLIYIQESIDESDITEAYEALVWINENTEMDEAVLSSLREGHLVTFFAERPNVLDENFINQKDASIRLQDVNSIYKTRYLTEAVPLLNKYNAKYILFTPETAQEYNLRDLRFLSERCFELVYDDEAKVYKSLCRMTQ